jgi:hypothetical protein
MRILDGYVGSEWTPKAMSATAATAPATQAIQPRVTAGFRAVPWVRAVARWKVVGTRWPPEVRVS